MKTVRLTMAQALVRYLAAQRIRTADGSEQLFHGVFAIFGHGNVAGLGEALAGCREQLPTLRAHNEQAMALAAVAFAKASRRRRMMACTTSVGPGATNLVTAAAVAHANRLPVLLLPGDTFANRRPDPVLQQLEHFGDPTVTANDCLRPVSRYWDRITRPEQLLASLPQALSVLLDPADCGPATLALPQDVQAEAFDYPLAFFDECIHEIERPRADQGRLQDAIAALRAAQRPFIVAGGGVHYAGACEVLARFAEAHGIPVGETQAGKGALAWNHPCNAGALGVTGSSAANELLAHADTVLALGTRLADFTTGSGKLIGDYGQRLISVNVARHDARKRNALGLRGDVLVTLAELEAALAGWSAEAAWRERLRTLVTAWNSAVDEATRPTPGLPTDAQVLGAVNR
ncbi:MAG: thiamine pyrophosphate-binding protein, partial [Pseudomonadota bacterium]|nr:thiamine pyrophosphate-binding protein [Pseudomonadota bacterium]